MSKQPYLFVENLCMRFGGDKRGDELVVFDEVTFGVDKGEFVSIIGHSGCGKSTILNIIAGLAAPSSGYVFVNGRQVTQPGLGRGVIFQNHSLLPWKTALGNVVFSVRARHPEWSKDQVREHSMKYLSMVGLEGAEGRKPAQLSGGMRQRVGIARAFAIEPGLLLMDEPFGALDALTRGTIQDELIAICAETGQTVFMITHDVDEAIYLSDRILLMSNGPDARVAEQVPVNIPRPRSRAQLAKQAEYYDLRTSLIDFLVERAHRKSPVVRPKPGEDQADEVPSERSLPRVQKLASGDST
jgi:nitrate/nitrite transport system ATP-binding protein